MKLIKQPIKLIPALGANGVFNWLPDKIYIQLLYYCKTGRFINLDAPATFNEKLQWLKLYDRNYKYIKLVDKIEAKHVVGRLIGQEHIVPIYGIWKNANAIDFSGLPNEFVLKCNHDQGSVILVKDKTIIDKDKTIYFLNRRLKRSPYPGTREYIYSKIERRIFAEKYLGDSIIDYKFYCFSGEPKFLYCGQGLTENHTLKIDFFDMEWNRMPFYRTDYERLGNVAKPKTFNEMVMIAKELSKGLPFVRIDLFEVNDNVYFSEFTLCPASGFMPFVPEEYDMIVGNWLELPLQQFS